MSTFDLGVVVKNEPLISSLVTSLLLHVLAIPLAATLLARTTSVPSYETILVDIIDVPRVEEKKVDVAKAQPVRPKPEKVTPPKLASKPEAVEAESRPVAPSYPPRTDEPERTSFPLAQAPAGPEEGSSVSKNSPGEAEGAEAGAGNLFAKGDVAVVAGTAVGGGGGGKGIVGLGREARGDGSGGGGFGQALGIARPLGGYQVKPRYPDSARRAGIQGVTLLKVRVLENGNVGETFVEQSAGHPDLDRSAAEAVKKWRFEPARKGNETVAVWVLLPVRFQLQ